MGGYGEGINISRPKILFLRICEEGERSKVRFDPTDHYGDNIHSHCPNGGLCFNIEDFSNYSTGSFANLNLSKLSKLIFFIVSFKFNYSHLLNPDSYPT